MNIYWLLGAIVISFSAGAYTEHKFSLADKVSSAYDSLAKSQEGQMTIISKDQQLEKNYAIHKEPCDNVIVPSDDNRVLH